MLGRIVRVHMQEEMDDSSSGSGRTTVECFADGCETEMPVAIWSDNVLSGKLLPVCVECDEDRPEFNLWDASAIEESEPPYGPKEQEDHPIPEGEAYVVVDKHRNWEEEMEEIYGVSTEDELAEQTDMDVPSSAFEKPDELYLEIFIRDPSDTEVLQEAREEARQMLAGQ